MRMAGHARMSGSDVVDTKELTVLSLCTGYGGLELGLSRALENPLRVVAVEVETYALANLEAKAAEGRLAIEAMWEDLRTFPAERFRGCFDFLLAGYPCQPFSCAGKRAGEDDPRHLWPAIAEIVRAVQPLWCLFENVPGHLSLGFPGVYRSLRSMGYAVEAGLFTAAQCGAPHKRQRLFVLARLENAGDGLYRAAGISPGQECCGTKEAGGPEQCPSVPIGASEDERGNSLVPHPPGRGCGELRWPAPPGCEQYEWEEPRVVYPAGYVDDAGSEEPRGVSSIKREENPTVGDASTGQAQSSVGRAVDERAGWLDGCRYRVDRLRLLGNGCVPAQVEKAFRDLWQKHMKVNG